MTEQGAGERKTNIGEAYGVQAYPTKILINPQGIIIGRYISSNAGELDVQLKAIFGAK